MELFELGFVAEVEVEVFETSKQNLEVVLEVEQFEGVLKDGQTSFEVRAFVWNV